MPAAIVKNWSAEDWQANVTKLSPPCGGKVGVVFAHVQNGTTPSFVLKPAAAAASTTLGEDVLDTVGAATTLHTVSIDKASPQGYVIRRTLNKFSLYETDEEKKQAWTRFLDAVKGAKLFLVQDFLAGAQKMDDYRKGDTLRQLLQDKEFMKGLGKLYAADAIIGNGDRLSFTNTGNIMFNKNTNGTYSFYAMDTAAILTNYQAVLNDARQEASKKDPTQSQAVGRYGNTKPTPQDWAKDYTEKGTGTPGAVPGYSGEQTPQTFATGNLFEYKNWWDKEFRPHMQDGIRLGLKQRTMFVADEPVEKDWTKARKWFGEGVQVGISEVDSLLSAKYEWLKARFAYYKQQLGSDPNMDWMNLKIRRVYFQNFKKTKNHDKALAAMLDYVGKKETKGTLNKYA